MALAPDAHFEAKDDKQFRRRRDGGGRYHRGATTLRLATQLARVSRVRRRRRGLGRKRPAP
jgi:hypothetical protein